MRKRRSEEERRMKRERIIKDKKTYRKREK
jgi:hypothetical protein